MPSLAITRIVLQYIAVMLALGFLLAIALTHPSRAHSFYPWRCCHDIDCAPVKSWEKRPDGSYFITLENGLSAPLRKNYLEAERQKGGIPEILTSPDIKLHACIMTNEGVRYVRCIFIPGRM